MGLEVRRVPPFWEHPKDHDKGTYLPMFDRTLAEDQAEWDRNNALWEEGVHPDQVRARGNGLSLEQPYNPLNYKTYADWTQPRADDDATWFRPAFEHEPTFYQVYENTTEGTPISPVLRSVKQVVEWLVTNRGLSQEIAENTVRPGMSGLIKIREET